MNQLIAIKNELIIRREELIAVSKRLEAASTHQIIATEAELHQIHETTNSLQSYVFELEAKIEQTKRVF